MITTLNHVSVKTPDLQRTIRFYTQVLGLELGHRPDFGFPGAWLGTPEGGALIHLYAGGPGLQPDGRPFEGSASVDHFALTARGFAAYRQRIQQAGLDWREQVIPEIRVWQLFVYDPNGVMVELNFDGSEEEGLPPDMSPGRRYVPGENFYRPAAS
jgi:catechol 2,3-dioxygenase-like lactoylglutathione lyase family enzyme